MAITISAPVISGAGRGKKIGFPTINLDTNAVPEGTAQGIYAAWAQWHGAKYMAAVHYGARPVFDDDPSLEVHIIDEEVINPPTEMTLTLVKHLRDVSDFSSVDALIEQLQMDIAQARVILQNA